MRDTNFKEETDCPPSPPLVSELVNQNQPGPRHQYQDYGIQGEKWKKCLRVAGDDYLNQARGVYAISVSGRLPAAVQRDMRASNIAHRSRDTSKR